MAWGRIFKRGEYWFTDIRHHGQRRRKKIGKNRQVAETILQKTLGDLTLSDHGIIRDEKIKLEAFAVEYLAHKKNDMKPRSYQRVEGILRANVLPVFGKHYLFDITTDRIQRYINKRLTQGVMNATANRELSVLRNLFGTAVKWHRLRANPCTGVSELKEPPGRLKFLNPAQIRKLLEACPPAPHPLKVIILMAVASGMRRGEIIGLRWDYVKLAEGFIVLPLTKNNTVRAIPINETLRKVLEAMPDKRGYVFGGDKPLGNFNRGWLAACKGAELENFRFHDLRHTYASIMTMEGIPARVLQDLLGHKTLAMTARYSHLAPAHLQNAAKVMDKVLTA